MAGVMTKTTDYEYDVEGVNYGRIIIKQLMTEIAEELRICANPEVMGGEDGIAFGKKLLEVAETMEGVVNTYDKLGNKVSEVASANGAFVQNTMSASFEEAQKKFSTIKDEVASFKGQKK